MDQELKDFLEENIDVPAEQEQAQTDETKQDENNEQLDSSVVNQDEEVSTADANVESSTTDELSLLKQQNEALLQQLNALSTRKVQEEKPAEEQETVKKLEESELFGEWTYDAIVEDENSFKRFLGEFANKVKTSTEESILRKIPGTVSKLTNEQIEARNTVNQFYEEHPQLAQTKPYMAQIVTTVSAEHADWGLEQVLTESANRAYKALGLQKQATQPAKSQKPAFAGPASGKRTSTTEAKSRLEKELEELMELEG